MLKRIINRLRELDELYGDRIARYRTLIDLLIILHVVLSAGFDLWNRFKT